MMRLLYATFFWLYHQSVGYIVSFKALWLKGFPIAIGNIWGNFKVQYLNFQVVALIKALIEALIKALIIAPPFSILWVSQ